MSRIVTVWSGLDSDEEDENTVRDERQLVASIEKNEPTARNADRTEDSPFQEVPPVKGKHMAIYDLPEGQPIDDFDARVRTSLGEIPDDACLNARCYKQMKRWDGEYWRDDTRDVRMWCVVIWQPAADIRDEVMEWFINEFTPGMLGSPELLRIRLFKLENVSHIRGQKQEDVDKDSFLQYMTIWEFETEEFPWEIMVYLGSSEKWRLYVEDGKLEWQIAQYLVNDPEPEDDVPTIEIPGEYQDKDEDDRNGVQYSSEDEGTDQEEDDSDSFEIR